MIKSELVHSSNALLNVRLCLYSLAWVHLIITAIVILPIDISQDEDPRIKIYERLKWRFITTWFNFLNLAYFPLCLLCDWSERRGNGELEQVAVLRKIRDVLFTCVLFPTILFADISFWLLYHKDITLITPVALFDYLPSWGQHSLHSVSLLAAVLDVFLVPRLRPVSLKPRLAVMTTFFAIYTSVVFYSYLNGDMVYLILEIISGFEAVILVLSFYALYLLYFMMQWFIIARIWGTSEVKNKIK